MITAEFDIVIVGGGCIGSSIAFELSQRGNRNIALLDNGAKTISATASSGGMLRVFHEQSDHVEMSLNNFELLKSYQDRNVLNENHQTNGNLYFFDHRRFRDYQNNLQKMESHQYPFEVLTSKQGQQRFHQFQWSSDQWAIFEPLATHISPGLFSEELLRAAQTNGLTLKDNFEVERIRHFRNQYRIFSPDAVVVTKTLILAGGARILPLLKELGIAHTLRSQALSHFRASKLHLNLEMPNYFDREKLEYARFGFGSEVILSNPNTQRILKQYWQSETLTEHIAYDCYSPNRMGYAGYLMGHRRLMLATGWGGTAFKFALSIGRRIAQALETETNERGIIHV